MTPEELESAVGELQDRRAIWDCVAAFARAIDRLDRELLLSVFHEDAIDDHGMFVGSPREFADWVIPMHTATHLSHQHYVTNHTCELDGSVAHAETYYLFAALNRGATGLALSGGRYVDRFERRDGRWAIATRVCVREWSSAAEDADPTDPTTLTPIRELLPPELRQLMLGGPLPTRDRDDPSYDRPLFVEPARVDRGRRTD